jgi:hypothetical protein
VADPERNTVLFKNGEETYSVEELVAQLLSRAQEFAQDAAGKNYSFLFVKIRNLNKVIFQPNQSRSVLS